MDDLTFIQLKSLKPYKIIAHYIFEDKTLYFNAELEYEDITIDIEMKEAIQMHKKLVKEYLLSLLPNSSEEFNLLLCNYSELLMIALSK